MDIEKLEQEITAATQVNPDDYEDRQDYLAAAVRALSKLKQDDFENLSEDAFNWHTEAGKALNAKRKDPDMEIPDFDNEAAEAEGVASDDDDEVEVEAEESETTDEVEESETDEDAPAEAADGVDPVPEEEREIATEPAAGTRKNKKVRAPKVIPPKKDSKNRTGWRRANIGSKAGPKEGVKGRGINTKGANLKVLPTVGGNIKPRENPKAPLKDYTKLTGAVDRFGVILGTKTADAVAMYEKPEGASAFEIDQKVGGRFYNILKKLELEGHRVERLDDGRWKLTHKDDIKADKPKGKNK